MFLNRTPNSLTSDIRARLPKPLPPRLGVAVSGGGDSVALMHLLAEIAADEGTDLYAATVDHGLRPEAAEEAQIVARQAADLGLKHDVLKWQGWDGSGNLQDQARQARYALLTQWARANSIPAIALGHTADDQAETVLMRLARSAGVTGLAAMPNSHVRAGITILRPMLETTRHSLRVYLSDKGLNWIEDPSNQDKRFDRIKARKALADLSPLGITPETLSRVASNLSQARKALDLFTQESARKVTGVFDGDVCVDRTAFQTLPAEIKRRLLVGILGWISGPGYPPRQSAVDQAVEALDNGQAGSLSGCLLVPQAANTWICREFQAVANLKARPAARWDARWILSGPGADGFEIRALGEAGLASVPDWRAAGRPRLALQSSPAIWHGDELQAAPLAGFPNGWVAELVPEWPEFYASFLSH